MTARKQNSHTFSEEDILFLCPHCGKSMAIEKRGMGLTIQCPDCDGLVEVPTLTDPELKALESAPPTAKSGQPDLHSVLPGCDEIIKRLESLQEKHREIESRFDAQQTAIASLQQNIQQLQDAMETLSGELAAAAD